MLRRRDPGAGFSGRRFLRPLERFGKLACIKPQSVYIPPSFSYNRKDSQLQLLYFFSHLLCLPNLTQWD